MKKIYLYFLILFFFFIIPWDTQAASPLQEAKEMIRSEYVGEIKGNINSARTIDELIEMLDPYSAYFSNNEFQEFLDSVNMKQIGIGVVIQLHEEGLLVTNVIEKGSAAENGIEPGDIITKVDSISLKGKSLEEGQKLILGDENTRVTLEILKPNGQKVVKILTRKPFSIPVATSKLLYGNVGYIYLLSFSEDAADLIKKEYTKLKNQGATTFILDLQNNGGGYVDAAEEVIALFKDASYAYQVKMKENNTNYYLYYDNEDNKYTLTENGALLIGLPKYIQPIFDSNTKLLINRYSASASEMTAAALKDYNAAVLYGENTYGKGTMQGFYGLSDNGYLKLTIGEFLSPKGNSINKIGVKPNIETSSDPIYQAHYDAIKEQLANYKELKSLMNIPTTKTFKVTLNRKIGTVKDDDVDLVALGGNQIEVDLHAEGNELYITPKQPLTSGAEYMLIVHPTLKDSKGKSPINGIYLHITVEN